MRSIANAGIQGWFTVSLAISMWVCCASAQMNSPQLAGMDQLRQGARLQQQGRLKEAIEVLAPLAHAEGTDPVVEGRAMILMGLAYQDLGRWRDAQTAYEKAIAIFRGNPANPKEEFAALDDLGSLYRDMQMPDESKALRKQVLKDSESAGDRAGVARANNNLAEICLDEGKRGEAKKYLGKALAGMEAGTDLDGDDEAAILSTAGKLALLEGDGAKALSYYRRSLALWSNAHGEKHFLTGRGYVFIANSYMAMGSFPEAVHAYQRGLNILRDTMGEKSAIYCFGQIAYAHALAKAGNKTEAAQIEMDARAVLTSLRSQQCAGCTINVSALR